MADRGLGISIEEHTIAWQRRAEHEAMGARFFVSLHDKIKDPSLLREARACQRNAAIYYQCARIFAGVES